MTLVDLAQTYIAFNINNPHTEAKLLDACRLFDRRSAHAGLDKLGEADLRRFRERSLDRVNAFTYNGYLGHIKAVVKWAGETEKIEAGTAKLFRMLGRVPEPQAAPKALAREDYRAVLGYLAQPGCAVPCAWFWRIAIRFLYATGCRRRQLVAVLMEDLDIDRRRLRLACHGSKTHREWHIPLAEGIVPDIERLIDASEAAIGRVLEPEEPLFNICRFNRRMTPCPDFPERMRARQVTETFKLIRRHTNIPIGAHRLRHTTATDLCNPEGNTPPDLFLAQHILGHSDLQTTRRYVQTDITRRAAYFASMLKL